MVFSISNPFDGIIDTPSTAATSGLAGRSFSIEEQGIPNARRITLRGRAMPYQDVAWGGEQRSKLTHYPGNPNATQQILGPVEENTTLEGTWKDRFMAGSLNISPVGGGEGPFNSLLRGSVQNAIEAGRSAAGLADPDGLILAEEAVQIFHAIRRAGTTLRVQYLSEVRFGILKSFTATYARPQDIAWGMEFEWSSWDDDVKLRSPEEPKSKEAVLDALNAALDFIAAAPGIVRSFTAGLNNVIEEVADLTQVLFDTLATVDALTDLPGTVLGQLLNTGRELAIRLRDAIRRIGDVRWPNISSAQSLAGPTKDPTDLATTISDPLRQLLQFERWRRGSVRALSVLRREASDAVDQRVRQRIPKTTRIITTSAEATLYDIANKYYGAPDFAGYIASVNGLTTARLEAGTQLRLPPRPTGPQFVELSQGRSKDCGDCC